MSIAEKIEPLAYKVANPVMKALLRSPLHGLVSKNIALLHFRGRKSGRDFVTPLSYVRQGHSVWLLSAHSTRWWMNLREKGTPVSLEIARETLAGQAWPLPEVANQNWYLCAQASGSINSAYDGSLCSELRADSGPAQYEVDYEVSMGDCDRMRFMLRDVVIRHPDLVERARKCMTFTGPVIEAGIEITGSPTLHLQMQTSASSGAVFATLEAVLPDGDVFHITEGWLNLADRKISQCPRPHAGSAWHSQRSEDRMPVVPGETMQVGQPNCKMYGSASLL